MMHVILLIFLVLTGGIAYGQERWESFTGADGPEDIRIDMLESDNTRSVIEVDIPGIWVLDLEAESETFQRIRVPSAGKTADIGFPEMPYIGRFFAVPHNADIELHVTWLDSLVLPGYNIWPAQEPIPDLDGAAVPFSKDEEFYGGRGSFPTRETGVSGIRSVRGVHTALIGVFPMRFLPESGSIHVYTRFRVEVEFIGGSGYFIEDRLRSPYFEPLYAGMLLNYPALGQYAERGPVRDDEAEFLIIVPDGFEAAVEPLATWRTKSGLQTMVKSLSDVGGNASGIEQYIHDAYTMWETPPSFVLLVGDADHIPTNYRYTHPYHGSLTGTDLWYFTVDGDDEFADIHHGRISVEDLSGTAVLNKILEYEQNPPTGQWNNHVFLAAYEEYGRYFTIVSDMIFDYLTSIGYDCDRAYEAGTPPGTTQDVIDNFNVGSFIVNHRDHGDTDGWSHPSFTITHLPQLANGDMLPVVYSLNCLTGYFDAETDQSGGTFESFCEELLRKPVGGAVGVIGATRVSYSGYNDELVKGLYDAMWPDFDPGYPGVISDNPWPSPTYRQGIVLNFAKWWMYDKYVLTNGAGYPWSPDPTTTRCEMEMFHYHGDPFFEIHTAEPTAMVISHDPATVVGVPSFTVYADTDGALVAVSMGGVLLGTAPVNSGVATVTFDDPPTIPGTMDVIVTAHNRIPYQGAVEVAPASGWYVVIDSVGVEDFQGHIDGVIEQGDSLNVGLQLWNVGSQTALDVLGSLQCSDPNATVVIGEQGYGDISPDGLSPGAGSYVVALAGGIPDGYAVQFELDVDAGDSSWIRPFSLQVHAPVLEYAGFEVDDASGNGNGRPDPGEVIDLIVELENTGTGTASQINATLECDNPDVVILGSQTAYQDIGPGENAANNSPFQVAFSSMIDEGTIVPFALQIDGFGPFFANLEFSLVVGQHTALFVDTDDETHEQRLVDALDASGYEYHHWDVPSMGPVPLDTLRLYRVIVWTAGDQNVSSMTDTERQAMSQYLDEGGALFFTAENYLTSYGGDAFTTDYLHTDEYTTSITVDQVVGVAGDPIADGILLQTQYPSGMSTYPDEIVPAPEAAGILTVNDSGDFTALRYPSTGASPYRVVFMATPFEALEPGNPPPNNPDTFLARSLAWLLREGDLMAPEAIADLRATGEPGQQEVSLSWSMPWDDIGVTHYNIYRGNSARVQPTQAYFVTTVYDLTWTDNTGAGDPAENHFYIVTALDAASNESSRSNTVGEQDYVISPGDE